MIEIEPGSISLLNSPLTPQAPTIDVGTVRVTGEIVDSKCYLGVMNPGNGKVHRDCAARCISGGIAPIFVSMDGEQQFLLVGPDGDAIAPDTLREFVAEPITVRGEQLQKEGSRLLRVDVRELHHTPHKIESAQRASNSRK